VAPTGDIHVVPVEGGTARNLTTDIRQTMGATLCAGRPTLAFGRQTIRDFYADRVRLVLHDRKTGANRVVTDAWDRSVAGLVWIPDSAR